MTYVNDSFVNELISTAHAEIDRDPDRAVEQADRIIDLLDAGTLVSETPLVIVDKARALRDRARLASLFKRASVVKDDGLLDLERLWFMK